ncbi:uncharacterized protein LOC62_02G002764 [Vanrija pseudolonga]|uniref:Uncharacterized protein n=1 Tax=Vanrija pseudolonga TaxID=143232 RepID=A0AAF0Y7C5_9TREE|nr:hypothetical protein LOC62_02G002764 [Vanrija pseudolonga]
MSDFNAEDSLAAAFNSSFAMPAAPPRAAAPAAPEPEAEPAAAEAAGAELEVEDWKPSYEANLAVWEAEAAEARTKAEATRAKYEDEAAAAAKATADEGKKAAAAAKEATARAERETRLASALAEEPPRPHHKKAADTASKVREAWELVKDSPTPTASAPASQTWEEISAPHSSVEDISASSPDRNVSDEKHSTATGLPVQTSHAVGAGAADNGGPTQPPSLTLSIFTNHGALTARRVLAALGINLVLPFINGIMLGLGEITAREAVRVGRLWWRGERAIAGIWHRKPSSGAGSVSGVGLSGSGGF